jgi:hypothetical protein
MGIAVRTFAFAALAASALIAIAIVRTSQKSVLAQKYYYVPTSSVQKTVHFAVVYQNRTQYCFLYAN